MNSRPCGRGEGSYIGERPEGPTVVLRTAGPSGLSQDYGGHHAQTGVGFSGLHSPARNLRCARRVTHSPHLMDPSIVAEAFDDLVSQQR